MAGFGSYTARSEIRPDMPAGPIGRKRSVSNGPPAETAVDDAGVWSERPTIDCAPKAAKRARTRARNRDGLMERLQVLRTGADYRAGARETFPESVSDPSDRNSSWSPTVSVNAIRRSSRAASAAINDASMAYSSSASARWMRSPARFATSRSMSLDVYTATRDAAFDARCKRAASGFPISIQD